MDDPAGIQHVDLALRADILHLLGLPQTSRWEKFIAASFGKATRRLAQIALSFDRMIPRDGLRDACDWVLQNWCRGIRARGSGNIPQEGPLLVISNHPGTYDALVIASRIPRPDLQIIASDLPFLRSLENFRRRVCFIPLDRKNTAGRMAGLLSAVHHVRRGGAVLLMGSGTIDPDPAVAGGALENLKRWTDAAALFLELLPQTRINLSAISHILHPRWARHPLTWFMQPGLARRRIAEFGQVIQQLLTPGSLYVSPCVSFSTPFERASLGENPRLGLIQKETELLTDHCQEFGGLLT